MALHKTMFYITVLFILCACQGKHDCLQTPTERKQSPLDTSEVLSREKRDERAAIFEEIATIKIEIIDIPDDIIELIKETLSTLTYPYSFLNVVNVTAANISTVCYPNSTCVCGEQYGWPCDKCLSYGSCDKISKNMCGCINSIPSDGQFCQTITNITACPSPTPVSETILYLNFTMDLTFDPAFNDVNKEMFKEINQTIRDVYQRDMKGFISSTLNGFLFQAS
ncbi:uncharacterized protein LOC105025104 isoform X2 [Esox lucius]|uniref:uncharacterized protein LOC105025104 isoform X2 n=1 Tax=Esox lucius TaxID=8010 RepID=UPI001476DEA7|nr:uncharacterized protein LOC105025104 isoform X2 [Esox lucius]